MVLAANSFRTAEKERGESGILYRLTARHELLGSHQCIHGVPSIPGHQQSFVYTRGIDICWVHQAINVLLPLSGHQQSSFIPGRQQSFVYTRGIDICWVHQAINVLLPLSSHQQSSFIPGRQQFFVYTRSSAIFCLYQGEAGYSHQWPRCGESFLCLYTPEERFLCRLYEWRLGELDPRLWDDSGQRVSSSRLVSGMSMIVGGRSARLRAAVSGGVASNAYQDERRGAAGISDLA